MKLYVNVELESEGYIESVFSSRIEVRNSSPYVNIHQERQVSGPMLTLNSMWSRVISEVFSEALQSKQDGSEHTLDWWKSVRAMEVEYIFSISFTHDLVNHEVGQKVS